MENILCCLVFLSLNMVDVQPIVIFVMFNVVLQAKSSAGYDNLFITPVITVDVQRSQESATGVRQAASSFLKDHTSDFHEQNMYM